MECASGLWQSRMGPAQLHLGSPAIRTTVRLEISEGQPSLSQKMSEEVKDKVKEHIDSFPRIESNYFRKDTNREYFGTDLSTVQLYQLYKARDKKVRMWYSSTAARASLGLNLTMASSTTPERTNDKAAPALPRHLSRKISHYRSSAKRKNDES